ncbi:uncharacterized protein K452DRAFT_59144 [Aplosporella prunicola CBS 121167]|uniref:Secreted protein n=1 Tax=Aplosporella prunicola CBS 121167 TaxID=1176127 RepID=A0A6A6B7V6_9PEZI|nr:uncharacterized protein K452DRAFT_59144 [Aplosporella prunicola CBS 121167]KAF2139996.1 hypothetical protein K452DRAFT_59144 [Aplosporella prunicola CBS 121167]
MVPTIAGRWARGCGLCVILLPRIVCFAWGDLRGEAWAWQGMACVRGGVRELPMPCRAVPCWGREGGRGSEACAAHSWNPVAGIAARYAMCALDMSRGVWSFPASLCRSYRPMLRRSNEMQKRNAITKCKNARRQCKTRWPKNAGAACCCCCCCQCNECHCSCARRRGLRCSGCDQSGDVLF